MALTTLDAALSQFNTNILWQGDLTKAQLLYEAVLWLIVNRPQETDLLKHGVTYESLRELQAELGRYVKAGAGKSRTFTRGRALS